MAADPAAGGHEAAGAGELRIGQRLRVDKDKATLRFVGTVSGSEGQWLGVEWDNPERGKHDGTHQGVRYFSCSHPTAASFIRPKKVVWGQSVCQAIRQRYAHTTTPEDAHVVLRDVDHRAVDVEVVNPNKVENKVRHLQQLLEAVLSDADVNDQTGDESLQELCPQLQALNLSDNLTASWDTVAKICRQAPHLRSLILNHNRLEAVPSNTSLYTDAFRGLQRLLACNMPLDWADALRLVERMPLLEELHLCENSISGLRTVPLEGKLQRLTMLNLYGNSIASWHDFAALTALPALETLLLNANKLGDWPEELAVPAFPRLATLGIGHNEMQSWSTIRRLGGIKTLKDVRLRGNRLGPDLRESEARKITIVFLPDVRSLNGSDINTRERQVAERYYLEYLSKDYFTAHRMKSLDQFYLQHPEYKRLVDAHGPPEEPAAVITNTMRDRLLRLHVAAGTDVSQPAVVHVEVPQTMTVGQLKRLLKRDRYLGTPMERQQLFVWDQERNNMLPLDDPLRQLGFYSVPNDARVFVDTSTVVGF